MCNGFEWPPRALWPYLEEELFYISRLSWPAGRDKRIFTRRSVPLRTIFLLIFLIATYGFAYNFYFLLELSDIVCYTVVARKYTPWGFMKGEIPI